jgi:hypothetical protein
MLQNLLVTFVGGGRQVVSPAQVEAHLLHHFNVAMDEV